MTRPSESTYKDEIAAVAGGVVGAGVAMTALPSLTGVVGSVASAGVGVMSSFLGASGIMGSAAAVFVGGVVGTVVGTVGVIAVGALVGATLAKMGTAAYIDITSKSPNSQTDSLTAATSRLAKAREVDAKKDMDIKPTLSV